MISALVDPTPVQDSKNYYLESIIGRYKWDVSGSRVLLLDLQFDGKEYGRDKIGYLHQGKEPWTLPEIFSVSRIMEYIDSVTDINIKFDFTSGQTNLIWTKEEWASLGKYGLHSSPDPRFDNALGSFAYDKGPFTLALQLRLPDPI